MIRINLLPVKAAKKRESGQRQVLVGLLFVIGALAIVVVFHGWASAKLVSKKVELNRVKDAIQRLKAEVGDYEDIKRQRDDLKRQKAAIAKLVAARTGPVYMMRELSDILTKGKGPTFDKAAYEDMVRRDPSAGINQSWEPKRAWIINYSEKAGAVALHGGAKSDEDVAEFLKRLKLSAFFSEVYWQQTQPQVDKDHNNVAYVTFDVACRVNY
jgi:type IV pilus assembly protein PilN